MQGWNKGMFGSFVDDIRPVDWKDGKVYLIDQTCIPETFKIIEYTDYRDVADAIRNMVVRGAPAIGVAAALGIALGAQSSKSSDVDGFLAELKLVAEEFRRTRPTAVNLFWAVDRMLDVVQNNSHLSVEEIKSCLVREALSILEEDIATNRRIGKHGAELIPDGATVLTHCNAGALATAGYGTALGVIRAAVEAGKQVRVIADETRPRLQGMRLTAWELHRIGIPVTVITDNMAAWVMVRGMVDCVIVGADRIASNGDVANKVGTYGLAILSKSHGIPFYVAAPVSSIDFSLSNGGEIPIEERSATEVTHIAGIQIAPEGVSVLNPAFDITPAEYITAIITEHGILEPPYKESLGKLKRICGL
jgi:methylthioribose-1-phosphate isomerase